MASGAWSTWAFSKGFLTLLGSIDPIMEFGKVKNPVEKAQVLQAPDAVVHLSVLKHRRDDESVTISAPGNGPMKTDGKNSPQAGGGVGGGGSGGKSDEKKRRRALRRAKKNEGGAVSAAAHLDLTDVEVNAAALEELLAGERQRVLSGGEDYWYYDVASDGYYYEQNGAKGWRRRMPNSAVHRMKEQNLMYSRPHRHLPPPFVHLRAPLRRRLRAVIFRARMTLKSSTKMNKKSRKMTMRAKIYEM
ncbi:unnamed protein product [Heligmosomoides polygyrus]|uniref:WW domain-containing protein n=1 Tax=Heligmosomoides polygyrus TaxID=6339 RepID=A0A183FEL8_HELPZ|nr:unnamed protein product [Heligmosomoides polygyrus]